MNIELLDILRCPFCGARLELVSSMFHRSISTNNPHQAVEWT